MCNNNSGAGASGRTPKRGRGSLRAKETRTAYVAKAAKTMPSQLSPNALLPCGLSGDACTLQRAIEKSERAQLNKYRNLLTVHNEGQESMADRKRSEEAFERACRVIPGGVNSPARAFGAVGGHPLVIERGDGPFIWDLDGNRYIDFVCSWGPLILGHRHPRVLGAIEQALKAGTSFGAPCEFETRMAELVVEAVPTAERVRFVNSGTEAAMTAIRLARGCTGRDKIIKFAGCYHGHVDSLLVQAGSSATTLGVPSSPGVPKGTTADTIVLEFNDIAGFEGVMDEQGEHVAAVIVEPVVGNMGTVAPLNGFLEALREQTRRHGALLIFDEVITGFRLAYGGAQQRFGISPDLTVLGKVIGGGMPVGAVAGPAQLMERLMPTGPVFQAGTLSGNPLAMAAGAAALEELRDRRPYEELERRARRLAEGLDDAAARAGVPHYVAQVGSMITIFFHDGPVTNYTEAKQCDTELFSKFFWGLIRRGVYWPCSQFEAAFISTAHTDAEITQAIEAARDALSEAASA